MTEIHLTMTAEQFALVSSAMGFLDAYMGRLTHEEAAVAITSSELDVYFENKNEVVAGIRNAHKSFTDQIGEEHPYGF